jgi:hypothetical protein
MSVEVMRLISSLVFTLFGLGAVGAGIAVVANFRGCKDEIMIPTVRGWVGWRFMASMFLAIGTIVLALSTPSLWSRLTQ